MSQPDPNKKMKKVEPKSTPKLNRMKKIFKRLKN